MYVADQAAHPEFYAIEHRVQRDRQAFLTILRRYPDLIYESGGQIVYAPAHPNVPVLAPSVNFAADQSASVENTGSSIIGTVRRSRRLMARDYRN
jgi:hypothetical protein